ncbi:ABC transporter ATP-binding protein [Photorhabdus tasmaniensis]|uniref:ABC transporter ATP-binding protein n=1 Tax=Photorhabdus tasmaniensis TaxID=1004159 RepID=UPI004041CF6C
MIKVENLSKKFSYYEKDEGLTSSIRNLFKRKKLIKTAVNNITFEIKKGEIASFLGPNGAGKSTALKILCGILSPSSGHVDVEGHKPFDREESFKKKISIVMGQKSQLWWDLPALDSFNLNRVIYNIPQGEFKSRLERLTGLLNVEAVLKVQLRRLSLGERMKMELIGALLHNPSVLLLDEPTIGLDIQTQDAVRKFIKTYNRESGCTVLLTSHYMGDVVSLCKRSLVINKGRLVFDGLTNDIKREIEDHKSIIITTHDKIPNSTTISNLVKDIEKIETGYEIKVSPDDIQHLIAELFNKISVKDLKIVEPPIEDAIRRLYDRTSI